MLRRPYSTCRTSWRRSRSWASSDLHSPPRRRRLRTGASRDAPARWGSECCISETWERVLGFCARPSPIGLDPARPDSFDERREPANLPLVAFEPRGVDLPLEREVLLMESD